MTTELHGDASGPRATSLRSPEPAAQSRPKVTPAIARRPATKAQARRLAGLWTVEPRHIFISAKAPEGREVFNDSTVMALVARGWIVPSGYPPVESRIVPGYWSEPYALSYDGMVALHRFIGREIELSAGDAPKGDVS